jgi:hypothetical protein
VNRDTAVSDYWLYEWMDEREVRKPGDLGKALRSAGAINRLLELQNTRSGTVNNNKDLQGQSIIAGRRVDLTGFLGCAHFDCVFPQIDTLFSRTWLYFDKVIIDDPELHNPDSDVDEFLWDIEQRVHLLLYLRKIGADENVSFTRKVSGFCQMHFREYAKSNNLDVDAIFDENAANSLIDELLSGGRFEITRREDDWHYHIYHPKLEPIIGTYSHSDPAIRPSEEECARDAYGMYCSGLIADVAAARELQVPLLQIAEGVKLSEQQHPVDSSMVALSLRLPYLANVPVKELLRLKRDEWGTFDLFRAALQKAIEEQIAAAGNGGSPEEIAQRVVDRYIRPEVAAIEAKLDTSKKSLRRKIGANVAVGGAAVSAGPMSHIPLVFATSVIGASIAAAKTFLPEYNKYSDAKAKAERSEYYFLWRARVKANDSWRHRRLFG